MEHKLGKRKRDLDSCASVFKHFDMEENEAVKQQVYTAGTGKHGVLRTGQNKLHMADLMAYLCFFLERGVIPDYVVVAGGAPGVHFHALIRMLPAHTEWHLYDVVAFAPHLHTLQDEGFICIMHKQLYLEQDGEFWASKKRVLFLSDIRNTNYTPTIEKLHRLKHNSNADTELESLRQELENMAQEDMTIQAQMVRQTQAEMSVIKLRFPYVEDGKEQEHEYLRGKIWFQYQNRPNSTECRLMVMPTEHFDKQQGRNVEFETKKYNISLHERKCAYMNNHMRPAWDSHARAIIKKVYEFMMQELCLTRRWMWV